MIVGQNFKQRIIFYVVYPLTDLSGFMIITDVLQMAGDLGKKRWNVPVYFGNMGLNSTLCRW